MEKAEILKQVKKLKKAMSEALEINGDIDKINALYTSEFTFTFKDGTTGKTYNINCFTCPEIWELMETIADDIPRLIEDYN